MQGGGVTYNPSTLFKHIEFMDRKIMPKPATNVKNPVMYLTISDIDT